MSVTSPDPRRWGSQARLGSAAVAALLLLLVSVLHVSDATGQSAEECAGAVPNAGTNPGLVSDCAVLLSVHDALGTNVTLNWDAGLRITSWDGVIVGGTPLRVTSLRLKELGLSAPILYAVTGLTGLEVLDLSRNRLSGAIPPAIGDLTDLKFLYLNGNELSGSIPPGLGSLSKLRHLLLDSNNLTGTVPSELVSLANLEFLHVQDNSLTGCVPRELADRVGLVVSHDGLPSCE